MLRGLVNLVSGIAHGIVSFFSSIAHGILNLFTPGRRGAHR